MNNLPDYFIWFVPFIIIDGVLKLIALWKAARNKQLIWFIALAIVNSVGILPTVYLIFFQPKQKTG